jgi:hypothetical protein
MGWILPLTTCKAFREMPIKSHDFNFHLIFIVHPPHAAIGALNTEIEAHPRHMYGTSAMYCFPKHFLNQAPTWRG